MQLAKLNNTNKTYINKNNYLAVNILKYWDYNVMIKIDKT